MKTSFHLIIKYLSSHSKKKPGKLTFLLYGRGTTYNFLQQGRDSIEPVPWSFLFLRQSCFVDQAGLRLTVAQCGLKCTVLPSAGTADVHPCDVRHRTGSCTFWEALYQLSYPPGLLFFVVLYLRVVLWYLLVWISLLSYFQGGDLIC